MTFLDDCMGLGLHVHAEPPEKHCKSTPARCLPRTKQAQRKAPGLSKRSRMTSKKSTLIARYQVLKSPHLQQCMPTSALGISGITGSGYVNSRRYTLQIILSTPVPGKKSLLTAAYLFVAFNPILQQQFLTAEERLYNFTAALPLNTTSGRKDWGSNMATHPRGTLNPALVHTNAIPIKTACCGASLNQT